MSDTTTAPHIAIASEIAERLEEMEQVKTLSSLAFVSALAALGAQSPVAYRIAVQFMHGCETRYASYADQSAKRGVSRQAIHREFIAHVAKIRAIFPEVAAQIMATRAAAHGGSGNANHAKTA